MKINTQLFILVASGTLGGLGLAFFIGTSYFRILEDEHQRGVDSVAIKMVYRLDEWAQHYLMTGDLITGGGGATYLLDGSLDQAKTIQLIIGELKSSPLSNSESQTALQKISECVRENQKMLVEFSFFPVGAVRTSAEELVLIEKIDEFSIPIAPAIEVVKEQFVENGRLVALQAKQQRRQTIRMAIVVGACYLFVVMIGWSWFRQQIVTPLERLSGSADASLRLSQSCSVEAISQSGPTEIRSLTAVIQNAVRDLRTARDHAIDANKAKDLFLANISHELRTPMNSIVGMSELVLDTSLTTQQAEFLRILNGSASSLMQLISNLLDVSMISSRELVLRSETFGLRETISDVIDMVSTDAYEQGLKLTLSIAPNVPECVTGDSVRLKQVLLNLLSNAIKFTPAGEVAMTVTCTDNEPDSSQSDHNTVLLFAVSDTGIGIANDKHEIIFCAFEQVDGSWTRAYGGAGLGLAISRQLVELMGGRIWLEGRQPRGSTFRFTACVKAQKNEPTWMRPGIADLKNHSILIIDDEDINRNSLENLLFGCRIKPVCTDEFDMGLSTLGQSADSGQPFGLVIFGVNDSTISAEERIEQIRSLPAYAQVPIIILAPSGQFFRDGKDCTFLLKPIRHSQLLDTIAFFGMQSSLETAGLPDDSLPGTSRPLRILVAEDNIPNQKIISLILTNADHIVTLVGSGRQALSAFSAHSFDLLFMDIQMPEMDGLQATIEIRKIERERGTHIPIVGLSGNALQQHMEEARRAGMDRFVTKPFTSSELLAALEVGAHSSLASAQREASD
jgi:signal transduction histidine kinase/CheY-like chemotaxis protein